MDRSSRGSCLFPLLTLNFSFSASQAGLGLEDILGRSELAFPLAAVLVGRGVVGIWTKWALGGGPMKESGCVRGQADLNWNSAHPTHSSSVVSSTKFLHRSFSCERRHNSRN